MDYRDAFHVIRGQKRGKMRSLRMAAAACFTGVALISGVLAAAPADAASVPRCKEWKSNNNATGNAKCGYTNSPTSHKYRAVVVCFSSSGVKYTVYGKWVTPIPRDRYGATSSHACSESGNAIVTDISHEFALA
jgi:hypothetical protein